MTWQKQVFENAMAEAGIWSPGYAEDVLVRLAHHSAALEGNTLSISDTVTLLVDELTPTAGKSLRELYEVANHREALTRVVLAAAGEKAKADQLAKDIHAALMDHLAFDKGHYKMSENIVRGASWRPVHPTRVAGAMREWAEQVEWQIQNIEGPEAITAIAQSHIDFERIHPFSDGNGRTGRALICYQTIRMFGVPAIIEVSQRMSYLKLLDADDGVGLGRMLAALIKAEAQRKKRYFSDSAG